MAQHVPHVGIGAPLAPSAASAAAAALDLELLQLCFDESEFGSLQGALRSHTSAEEEAAVEAEDFNPQLFVASKLEHVTPDVLERDLATYSRHLEAAVLKCVHEEVHEAFVDVSGQLVSMEPTIRRVQQPLVDMATRVAKARVALEEARGAARSALNVAVSHELSRSFFALLLEASLVHNKIHQGIENARAAMAATASRPTPQASPNANGNGHHHDDGGDGHATAAASPPTHSSPTVASPYPLAVSDVAAGDAAVYRDLMFLCAASVRLAQVVEQLQHVTPSSSNQLVAADDIAAAKDVARLATQDSHAVHELVCGYFAGAYAAYAKSPSAETGDALKQATDLFRHLDDEEGLAVYFKEKIVRPIVEEVITWRNASHVVKASFAETENLFAQLIRTLRSTVLVALPLIQQRLGSSISLLATALWPAVCDTISKRLTSFFAPGLPNAFHKAFSLGASLVAAVEDCCQSPAELELLRTSRDMAFWRGKWNVDVYHQLRRNELNERVAQKKYLEPPFVAVVGGSTAPFTIPQFHGVVSEVEWLLDAEQVFIYPAQDKFIRDVCDLVSRLVAAVKDNAKAAGPLDVIEMVRNCNELARTIDSTFEPALSAAMSADPKVVAPIVNFLRKIVDSGAAALRQSLVAGLNDKVMLGLTQVVSLKRYFTTQNATMPTEPSAYMHDAFREVENFKAEANRRSALSVEECNALVGEVILKTTRAFHTEVQKTLALAKKQQESLDRLKKPGPSNGAVDADKLPPREKIVKQLYLDIEEYAKQLRKFNVNKETYEPYKGLMGLVYARTQWLMGDRQDPEPADVV
jgi:hypothetical protein